LTDQLFQTAHSMPAPAVQPTRFSLLAPVKSGKPPVVAQLSV
jgi:hypothetical protein